MLMGSAHPLDPRPVGGDHLSGRVARDPGHLAIAHTRAMGFDDVEECFRCLYDYGSEPMDPFRAGSNDASAPILSEPMHAMLGCHFHHRRTGIWDAWSRLGATDPPVWKAYLNPRFVDLPIFAIRIGPMLLDERVSAFKMVAQRWMALRPDKFIVYFQCRSDRTAWIESVLPGLSGIAANPVPFTRLHVPSGLVTVATDPPDAPGQSWRSNLLRGIATRLVQPRPPGARALNDDLRRTGVDPRTWERLDDLQD